MDNKSGEIRTKTYSTKSVFVCGLRIPSRFSPCRTHSREMAQTSRFDPTTQVKTCFDCKMFDVANWVACLNGGNGPGGTPSHEGLSVSPQGALEISSVVGQPPSQWTETISAHLEWWNPTNMMKGADLHPKGHSIQLFTRLKRRLGRSLRAGLYKGSVVRQGKKATHKCSRAEGGFSGPSKVQGPVSKLNSVGCYGQLKGSTLHKQTRRNPLAGDVRSPVEDHDLVPSLSDNLKSQTHSRVSEYQCNCLIIEIAPGWPGMPWCWDLMQLSTEIPLQLPVSRTLLKQSHNYVLHSNPTTSQPARLVYRSGQLQEQGISVEVAERIAVSQRSSTRTNYKLKWALFEKLCRENSLDFSTHSVKQVSDFFRYLYQDLNRCPSTIDGYRMAIVDTLGQAGLHISQSSDLNRLRSSFHRDHPKSSRNLPKWNLSGVLNELTKVPFEPMKDTDLKHLPSKLLSC